MAAVNRQARQALELGHPQSSGGEALQAGTGGRPTACSLALATGPAVLTLAFGMMVF